MKSTNTSKIKSEDLYDNEARLELKHDQLVTKVRMKSVGAPCGVGRLKLEFIFKFTFVHLVHLTNP